MRRILVDNKTGQFTRDRGVKGKRKLLVGATLIVTGILSSLSDFHLERILGFEYSRLFDLLQHGGYYFLLTLTLLYLLPAERHSVIFFLFIFSFSVIFEAIQLLIPERTFSEFDIMSNFLGITTGFIVKNIYSVYLSKGH